MISQLNNPFVIIFTSPPEHQGCATACWFHVMREQRYLFHRTALVAPEKAMAPPLQYSCLENPMDGGAW